MASISRPGHDSGVLLAREASASRRAAASPSHRLTSPTPSRAPAASKTRPAPDAIGQLVSAANRTIVARLVFSICAAIGVKATNWSSPCRCKAATATRHGSRTAASPPTRGSGSRWANRFHSRPPLSASHSPPHAVASGPHPVPSSAMPRKRSPRPGKRPCSARTAATWARWCCTAMTLAPNRSPRSRAIQLLG